MDPERRRLLRRRFQEFKKLSSEDRLLIVEHGNRMEEIRERSVEGLAPEERLILQGLDSEVRRRILRDHFRQRSLEDGRRVMDKLPVEFLRRLEAAEPATQLRLLEDFRRAQRAREGRRLLELLGHEVGVPAEERARWDTLSADEQGSLLLQLGRRFIRQRVAEIGPPAGLSAAEWELLDAQGDAEFFEVWRRIEPSDAYLPRPRPASAGDVGQETPPARSWTDEGRLVAQAWRRVRELAKPAVGDLVDLLELSPAEREAAVAARSRARTLAFIREHGLLSPEDLAELEGLEGRQYLDALRRHARARFAPR